MVNELPDHSKAYEAIVTYLTTLDTDDDRLEALKAIGDAMCFFCGSIEHTLPAMIAKSDFCKQHGQTTNDAP